MIFICAMITFVTIILSIKELGLVNPYSRKLWVKVCIVGVISNVISMEWRKISIISLLISVLVILIWEKNRIINSLISETVAIFVAFVLDLLISPIFIKVVNNKAILDESGQFARAIITCLLSIIISRFIYNIGKKIMKQLNNLGLTKDVVSMKKWSTVLGCIAILVIFILNSYAMRDIKDKVDFVYLGIIVSISYCIVCGIIAFILYKNLKNEVLAKAKEKQLEDLRNYNDNLEIFYNDMRKFRHDYINILSSMAGYIEDGDMNGLKGYFEKKIVPLGTAISEKDSRIGLLQNILIKEIKGVVLTKVIRAQELGVSVYIDIAEEIESVNFDIVDLSRCIGIILDNAIESAVECKVGKIKVGFIKRNEDLIVAVMNSVEWDVPPIHKIYEEGFSTKGNNRGIGLSNLRELLSKYPQSTLDTMIEENEFKQILEIC